MCSQCFLLVVTASSMLFWTPVWLAQGVAAAAVRHRHRPSQQKLKKTLEVGGVGNGTQKEFREATLPMAMPTESGASIQQMSVPMVDGSDLPCLWGLNSLTSNRGIIDLITNQLHLCGPGDATIALPPGSTTIAMERDAHSGHFIVPCDLYDEASRSASSSSVPAPRVLHTQVASSSSVSSSTAAPKAAARGAHRG